MITFYFMKLINKRTLILVINMFHIVHNDILSKDFFGLLQNKRLNNHICIILFFGEWMMIVFRSSVEAECASPITVDLFVVIENSNKVACRGNLES